VSAGDQNAAVCDRGQNGAMHGINVNAHAATPFNVAVGGTDFSDTFSGTNSTYWNASNSSTFGSAKSYIPEIPWNGSCASVLIAQFVSFATTYGAGGFCNSNQAANNGFWTVTGGSGGPSLCATGTPSIPGVAGTGTCQGYPKPSWQTGIVGIPNDGVRGLPDVSMFSSLGPWGHALVFCNSDPNGGKSCAGNPSTWSAGGGTSFAAPIVAGIQALVNQYVGARQGNPNPVYYKLAAAEYGLTGNASCNSSKGNAVASTCIFYDVTAGDIDVDCVPLNGTGPLISCYRPSGAIGVLSTDLNSYQPAYAATVGWDFATGLGTINVNNLVTNWVKGASTPAVLTTPAPGSALTAAAVTFGWSAGSAVSQYWLSVGTTGAGSTDVYDKSAGSSLSATVSGLPVDGRTVNVRLWSLAFKIWQFNDYTYSAATGLKAAMSTPTPGSTLLGNSVTFSWTAGNLVSQYWLSVGTTGAGSTNLLDQSTGTNRSGTVGGLPLDGRTVNVRLWSLLGKNWQFTDYTYTAATAQGAVLTSPTPGSVLSSTTVTFAWTPGNLASQYWLYVGSTAGGNDLYDHSTGTGQSATVNHLPTDGRILFVRVWSLIGTRWVFNDYSFEAGPTAAMTTPAPQSVLAGNSVTFGWTAGSGVAEYWLWVGTTPLGFDLFNQATNARSQLVNNLPTDGRTVYVRLWSFVGAWQSNDCMFTASGAGARPAMTTPAPGATVPGGTVTFGWSAGTGISQYWLYVGSTPGGLDFFNASTGTSKSATVSGLPLDGRILYVRLWSLVGNTWQFNDYMYGAATGGVAQAASGPVLAGN